MDNNLPNTQNIPVPQMAADQPALPEIPMVANTPKFDSQLPPLPELPELPPAPVINTYSAPKPKSNKILIGAIVIMLLAGAAFILFTFTGSVNNNQVANQENPLLQEVIEEPISDEDRAAIAENVNLYAGVYETNTEILDSEMPDADSLYQDIPRKYARTLTLKDDNTAIMQSDVDGQKVTEAGRWSFILNSKTIKVELAPAENTNDAVPTYRSLVFDALDGDSLYSQSYDKMLYPDVSLIFYKK